MLWVILIISEVDIPRGAVLIYDIELLAIKDGPIEIENTFKVIDTDDDKNLTYNEVRLIIRNMAWSKPTKKLFNEGKYFRLWGQGCRRCCFFVRCV